MHFGVSFQSHILNSWKHAVLAEQMGFTHAWFVDTQMLAWTFMRAWFWRQSTHGRFT